MKYLSKSRDQVAKSRDHVDEIIKNENKTQIIGWGSITNRDREGLKNEAGQGITKWGSKITI